MQKKQSKSIGQQYEAFVADYLYRAGFELLTTNFVIKGGEVDLVMFDLHTNSYLFVEVKYRKSAQYGKAEESLTQHQQQRIITAAHGWLLKYHLNPLHTAIRFDLFAITGNQFSWIKSAF